MQDPVVENGSDGHKTLKRMASNAANSAFAFQINRLFAPIVLAALLGLSAWGFNTLQSVVAGVTHLQAQQDYDGQRLVNIEAIILSKGAQRDQQMADFNSRISDLTNKLNAQHDETATDINAMNLRIGNITSDMAILKCQLKKC